MLAGTRSDVFHRPGAAAIEERIELVKDLSAGDLAVATGTRKMSENSTSPLTVSVTSIR
jgi:hypothetical protein